MDLFLLDSPVIALIGAHFFFLFRETYLNYPPEGGGGMT